MKFEHNDIITLGIRAMIDYLEDQQFPEDDDLGDLDGENLPTSSLTGKRRRREPQIIGSEHASVGSAVNGCSISDFFQHAVRDLEDNETLESIIKNINLRLADMLSWDPMCTRETKVSICIIVRLIS